MKKLIVQSRRGTTSEWLSTSIIPRDGELVVEICETCSGSNDACLEAANQLAALKQSNKPEDIEAAASTIMCSACGLHLFADSMERKLKIGDGQTKFIDLPYITTPLEENVSRIDAELDQLIAGSDPLEGSWESEVANIRVTNSGLTYATAGDAVRSLEQDVSNLENNLSDFIGAKAVDGLYYEGNKLYLTANGQVLEDSEVTIVSGGGGGSSSSFKVRLTNLLESNSFTATKSDKVVLKFKFVSTEDDIPTGNFTCKIQVDGIDRKTLYNLPQTDVTEVDITDILNSGENTVRVTCIDMYDNSRTLVYNVNIIDLRLSSSFDAYKIYSTQETDKIDFRYYAYGAVDRTVSFKLNNNVIATKILKANTSGQEQQLIIPIEQFNHGRNSLEISCFAILGDNTTLTSNTLSYDVLVAVENETAPMVGSSYAGESIIQGNLISIPYIVYDPTRSVCDITLEITYKTETGAVGFYRSTPQSVDKSIKTWATRDYPVSDEVYFTIKYADKASRTKTVKVLESDISIDPISGPTIELLSAGRSNNESVPDSWVSGDIKTTFNNFNWVSNGWVLDSNGDTCLRINGGATAVIEYAPFKNFDIKNNGLTIELDFAIRDVNNRDTIVIDCFKDNSGFQATADTAFMKSTTDSVSCYYKDEERIKIAFTIDKDGMITETSESPRFLAVYLNGVLSSIVKYTSTEQSSVDFVHDGKIKLGDVGCTLDLYGIRIYDKALTARDITNNYIADISDYPTKLEKYEDNDIYTSAGLLSYAEVKKRIPTITFTGQMPTYKGDKRVVMMDFENPFDHSRDFSAVYGGAIPVEIDVQGTSSQWYVRKNWKIKLEKKKKDANGNTVKDENGKTVYEFKHAAYQHMADEIPAKVFCIKVDYAEATGTHNTQNANLVEKFYSEQIPPQADDARVRTTIAGFPCVIYERADENSTPIFSSKGNFNFDKDAEEAFGFTEDYDVECWEFCNNTSDSCNFLGEVPRDWVDDFEPRYTPFADEFEEIEELQELKDEATDSKTGLIDRTIFSEEQEERLLSLRDTVISEFKRMHDWVVSTKDNVDKFKREFTQYFDMHYSLIYYIYTFVALMTDQRAKNMFLTRWTTTIDGVSTTKWYPYFYDNDTSFGINNEGKLVFDYYHEDIDKVGINNVYNGQQSILWNNFRLAFATDIAQMYRSLRSDGKVSYEAIVNQLIHEGSDKWSASIYNEDAEFKYVTMARPENAHLNGDNGGTDADESGLVDTTNLYQVRGTGEAHLRYFAKNRIKYCDSKWSAGDYLNDYVLLRINTPIAMLYMTDDVIESKYLAADEVFTIGAKADQDLDTYVDILISYSSDTGEYGETECVIGPDGSGYVKFVAPRAGTYTFSSPEGYSLYSVAGYPEDATDEEKAEIDKYNDIINRTVIAVPPSPVIKVTPFSNMYCGVRYKANGTLYKARTVKNAEAIFGDQITETFNDTETAIFGASELSSLGDLSALYPSIVDASSASKLTTLIVGNATPGYSNSSLHEVNLGTNYLLQKLDLTNCSGLTSAIQVNNCPNISEIYALGTNVTEAALPAAGYLKVLELPNTITKLALTNQPELTDEKLKIGITGREMQNITELVIVNCDKLSVADILDQCLTENVNECALSKVRLSGINWSIDDITTLQKLYLPKSEGGYGLVGIDIDGSTMQGLNITGKCTLNFNINGDLMAELVNHFPNLTFVMGKGYSLTSTVYFYNDNLEEIYKQVLKTTYTTNITCQDPVLDLKIIAEPQRAESAQYTYKWEGWSRNPSFDRTTQSDALIDILGDRHLYPTFSKTLRDYVITFMTGDVKLYEANAQNSPENSYYGQTIEFNPELVQDSTLLKDGLPIKQNVINPDVYRFTGWSPEAGSKIVGNIVCRAQFCLDITEDDIYEAQISDFNYRFDAYNQLILTEYLNTEQSIIKIRDSYQIDDQEYTVYSIGDPIQHLDEQRNPIESDEVPFKDSLLEYIDIGNGVQVIGDFAFNGSMALNTLRIGRSVREVGNGAFIGCSNLTEIYYDVIQSDTVARTNPSPFNGISAMNLIVGPDVKLIPSNMYVQGSRASNADPAIDTLDFSEASSLTQIGTSAFYNVHPRSIDFNIDGALKKINQYGFGYNDFIEELELPEGLVTVSQEAFTSWEQLKEVSIPASVTDLQPLAFRDCVKLNKFNCAEGSKYLQIRNGLVYTDGPGYTLLHAVETGNDNPSIVELDDQITALTQGVFMGNKELVSIKIPDRVTQLPTQCFANTAALSDIDIPSSVKSFGNSCFVNTGLHYLDLSSTGVESFEQSCFYGAANLEEIIIPSTLSKLSDNCFQQSGLINIDLSSSNLGYIPRSCFKECYKLTDVKLPDSAEAIYDECFMNARNLASIQLGNSLNHLGVQAFSRCTSLSSIEIPDNKDGKTLWVYHAAFKYCEKLSEVKIYNPSVIFQEVNGKYEIFAGCADNLKIYVNWSAEDNVPGTDTKWGAPSTAQIIYKGEW